jgi:hypothetical protein
MNYFQLEYKSEPVSCALAVRADSRTHGLPLFRFTSLPLVTPDARYTWVAHTSLVARHWPSVINYSARLSLWRLDSGRFLQYPSVCVLNEAALSLFVDLTCPHIPFRLAVCTVLLLVWEEPFISRIYNNIMQLVSNECYVE